MLEELKRGDAPSSIAICMFENRTMEGGARKAMRDMTMETWKIVNRDVYVPNNCQYPPSFANACLNMARISNYIYQVAMVSVHQMMGKRWKIASYSWRL
jgi:hypothetical protein